ncbi:hypothetical protein DY000_02009604 [Brassica cretica]|uniref:Uncharacterized protein n=1 Tax=Brassica cretica TaxID=69181 RepID=A0ABQ7C408_BRACR|nr:hypothetical protein DY000_02009604 [Brassica cretica]
MSTRSNKGIGLLLLESLDFERVIHKSKRAVDTLQTAIGSVEIQASIALFIPHRSTLFTQASIDIIHPASIDTVHRDTVHRDTVHCNTVHLDTVHHGTVHPMTDTTCVETEKVELLILKVDENGLLRDKEDQDPFQGFLREDPRNHIEKLEDLASRTNLEIEMRSLLEYMVENDEQYGSGEPSSVEEADTSADLTQKSTDVSSCDLVPDVDREITIEDCLELEDEAQPENLDQNLEKKLDDDQPTSERDLGTSLKAGIDLHPPYIIDRHATYIIDLHLSDCINRHSPNDIDRHPSSDELPEYIVELEPVEEREYKSETSHLFVTRHLRPPICAKEAARFHKRVKRIHDPMKIMVPCDVSQVEWPIQPDRSMQLGTYSGLFDDHQHATASQRGLRLRDEVDKGPAKAASIDIGRIPSNDNNKPASIDTFTPTSIDIHRISEHKEYEVCRNIFGGGTTVRPDKSGERRGGIGRKGKRTKGGSQLSLIPYFSDGVRKSRVHSRCFSQPFAKLRALLIAETIDKGEEYMEEAFIQE